MEWPKALVASAAIAFLFAGITVITGAVMKVGQVSEWAHKRGEDGKIMRSLAEEAIVAQRRSPEELTAIRLSMADMRERVSAMEKMAREVG
jgi:hypothetical protein